MRQCQKVSRCPAAALHGAPADPQGGAYRGPEQHARALSALIPSVKFGQMASLEEMLRHLCGGAAAGGGSGGTHEEASLDFELHPNVLLALLK